MIDTIHAVDLFCGAGGNFSAAREIDLRMRKIMDLLIEAEANGIRYR